MVFTLGMFTLHWGDMSHMTQALSPSHLRSIHVISTIESMEVGTYHFKRGPKYDVIAYMATLFGGEAWDFCTFNTKLESREHFCIKYTRSKFHDDSPYFNGFLSLKRWDFASMLGLGAWDPM